jgi:SAM-dependent methyltransferase
MDTLAVLANSKVAFAGQSERAALASELDQILAKGKTVNWLEVGVGDGENLRYLLDTLDDGRQFAVTAIDPSPLATRRISSRPPVEVLSVKVESFRPTRRYDCINARQSAYYFEDPANTMLTLAGWLSRDGVLAATLWSQDCILYRLNRAISRAVCPQDAGLRAEDLIGPLPREEFVVERHIELCGPLNTDTLRSDHSAFAAICALVARKIDISALTEGHFAELFAALERLQAAGAERSNELLLVRRRP